jgi:hypothetical protein
LLKYIIRKRALKQLRDPPPLNDKDQPPATKDHNFFSTFDKISLFYKNQLIYADPGLLRVVFSYHLMAEPGTSLSITLGPVVEFASVAGVIVGAANKLDLVKQAILDAGGPDLKND